MFEVKLNSWELFLTIGKPHAVTTVLHNYIKLFYNIIIV